MLLKVRKNGFPVFLPLPPSHLKMDVICVCPKALSEEAFHRDSSDNITVVAVDLAAHLANISRL